MLWDNGWVQSSLQIRHFLKVNPDFIVLPEEDCLPYRIADRFQRVYDRYRLRI